MAEKKVIELQVNTNIQDTSKKIDGLKSSVEGAKTSVKGFKNETEKISSSGVDKLSGSLSNISPAFKNGIAGAKAFGTQLLLLAANPVGAVIIAVVGSLTLLYKAFTSTKAGGEALERVMSGIGATVDVLRDRILNVGNAIINFFSGDFKGALSEAKKSVSGIGSEIEKEFKQAAKAKRYLQEVDDALRSLGVSRAKLNRDLAKSKEIITDENASYAQKKKAIEEVRIAEEKQTQAELINAAKKLKAIKLANSLSDTGKEDLQKEATAQAELYALQEKSATDRRAIRKTEIRADKEEQARLKAIATERNAKEKEANDKRIAQLKIQEDEKKRIAKENLDLLMSSAKEAMTIQNTLQQSQETPAQKEQREYEEKKTILLANNLDLTLLNQQHEANLALITKTEADKKLAEAKIQADKEIALEQAIKEAKRNALDTGLNILMQFAGKNKAVALGILAVQKGLAIADIVVGSAKSISAATSALAAVPAVIGVVPNPMYAVQAASTIKGIALTKITAATSIASILAASIGQAKAITGGGGISSGGGGMGGGAAPAAPAFNVVGASATNQLAQTIGNQQQQPIKAYVVSNDVTTAQSLDRNIISSASIG